MEKTSSGILYVVATPIGNREDLSVRAGRILKEVDIILCEDTRHSARLLSPLGIKTPRWSFHEHNEREKEEHVIEELKSGKRIALISDAGTPTISDPGFRLVRACRQAGVNVTPIPGPVAAMTALMGAGFPTDQFAFMGFPPAAAGKRETFFKNALMLPMTTLFYLSPHKAKRHVADLAEQNPTRPACLCRELTKLYEEFRFGSLMEISDQIRDNPPKGELVLVLHPPEEGETSGNSEVDIKDALAALRADGLSGRRLADALRKQFSIPKKEAYRLAHEKD